jgi:hypothetical protein
MTRLFVRRNHIGVCFSGALIVKIWALLFCSSLAALAQSAAPSVTANSPLSIPAMHLLGMKDTKRNCNGTLSIQDNALQFRQHGKPGAQINTTSIQAIALGSESKQVGGVPMKLGKAAAPFGSGRIVSLVTHKKHDILTVEYVDGDGGVHGAIFELAKGQGELVRDSLKARSVSRASGEDRPTKHSTTEVMDESN